MDLEVPFKFVCKASAGFEIFDEDHFRQCSQRQKAFKVHSDTETIMLRFRREMKASSSSVGSQGFALMDYPLMEAYSSQVRCYLLQLASFYSFADFSVIVASLRANGGRIPLHLDRGDYFKLSHRVHIPIQTNPGVIFRVGGVSLHMKKDHVYEIGNTCFPHGVVNSGPRDRYHLIFDLFAQSFSDSPSVAFL